MIIRDGTPKIQNTFRSLYGINEARCTSCVNLRDLLRSMNERTRMQLRLQQTVEGLSVAAITYSTVGLVSYIIHGLKEAALISVDPSLATAFMVPIVLFAVAYILRHIRKGAMKEHS